MATEQQAEKPKRDWNVFFSSVFFVLGFSVIFSLVGVLLQTILTSVSYEVQDWLARIGGVIIIFFGLFLLGLIKPKFLSRDHKIRVKKKFESHFVTSFVFGAAFAVGWTPCVTAALGAILALASTQATSAFVLLMAYTLGLGLPFLLVGLFTTEAQAFINKAGRWLKWIECAFGVLLIIIGIFVFTNQLSRIANIGFLVNGVAGLDTGISIGGGISSLTMVNMGIAFAAGLVSFLSPCILPIIPGFLSYLATTAVKKEK
ncbi:TPA: cytochrome C biogenesis protein [Candidatus Woesearchaeota archaeon]|nr:cytochrome C biogenesis protein [Candidatus Woesearchaeota archaeon]HII68634.1 cytochrome C biogenesis protein [Candidatus Woesearchaeota archaeon]